MLSTKFQVKWSLGWGGEAKNRFSRWDGGHLGLSIKTILALFDLQVNPIIPTKFWFNLFNDLGVVENVKS